jgi:MFS family permease
MVSLAERGKWFGLISLMWSFGSVAGPVIGGALAQNLSWRWIFWINLPFCGIAYIAIPVFLKMNHVKGTLKEKLMRVDWVGSVLFVASITSILIPLTWVSRNDR